MRKSLIGLLTIFLVLVVVSSSGCIGSFNYSTKTNNNGGTSTKSSSDVEVQTFHVAGESNSTVNGTLTENESVVIINDPSVNGTYVIENSTNDSEPPVIVTSNPNTVQVDNVTGKIIIRGTVTIVKEVNGTIVVNKTINFEKQIPPRKFIKVYKINKRIEHLQDVISKIRDNKVRERIIRIQHEHIVNIMIMRNIHTKSNTTISMKMNITIINPYNNKTITIKNISELRMHQEFKVTHAIIIVPKYHMRIIVPYTEVPLVIDRIVNTYGDVKIIVIPYNVPKGKGMVWIQRHSWNITGSIPGVANSSMGGFFGNGHHKHKP